MKRSELVAKYGAEVWNRRTGKTLAIVLKSVGEALANPGTRIPLEDHVPHATVVALLPEVEKVIMKLGLKGFVLSRRDRTLRYDVPDDTFEG